MFTTIMKTVPHFWTKMEKLKDVIEYYYVNWLI